MEAITQEDILARIEIALDTIRPYLRADGGNVKVLNITDTYEVELELLGSCGSCPMSQMTMRAGIEEAIKKAVPEVRVVRAVNM